MDGKCEHQWINEGERIVDLVNEDTDKDEEATVIQYYCPLCKRCMHIVKEE